MKRVFQTAPVVLLFLFVISASGAEWGVGFAKQRITPEKPIPLSGYAARTKPFEKVDQDIFAKAMALSDGAPKRLLLPWISAFCPAMWLSPWRSAL
jgi:hypothetical protein